MCVFEITRLTCQEGMAREEGSVLKSTSPLKCRNQCNGTETKKPLDFVLRSTLSLLQYCSAVSCSLESAVAGEER